MPHVPPMKVRTALLLLAGAVLIYGLARRDAHLSRELQTWKDAAQQAVRDGANYRAERDSLAAREFAHMGRYRALQGDLARLRAHSMRAANIADTAQSVEPYRRALLASQNLGEACRATLAVADSGWTSCRARASLAETRAARLDSLLRVGVRVRGCRVLGIVNCPSRSVVLGVGLVGGFLLGRR